jgi:tRNA (guanine37-N1)-methyltransferase
VRIDVVTLFPQMFAGPFNASIVGRARAAGVLQVALHNPRDYTTDRQHVVDDYAYGGGPGMVMKPEPLFACVEAVRAMAAPAGRVVLLTPQGRLLTADVADELARAERLILVCGHYEGVDERVRAHLADDEISIGDYVLSGGEPAAIVLVDAVARHVPGVLGSEVSLVEESHAQGLLEYPQYTRPEEFRGHPVPPVLLSGHHAEIARWRREQSIIRTARRRPDLLARAALTPAEERIAAAALGVAAPQGPPLFRVSLPVGDIDAAARWYEALLNAPGQRVSERRHDVRCGAVLVELVAPEEGTGARTANAEPLYFAVADLMGAFARARQGGATVVDRIRKREWGERSFYISDPDGNPLCFVAEDTVFAGGRSVP